jgi:parvulin-like peptidyl-prolyl isomerase
MNTRRIAWILGLGLAATPVVRAGEVIDRIAAIVNGHVILQSQLEDDLCFEALSGARPLDSLSVQDRRSALNHLVDQELLREQAQAADLPQLAPEQVQKRIQEIRAAHPEAVSDSGWRATLARYGLNEKQLESRVALELALLREVDNRLRPSVQIENERIESYYRDVFLPQLHKAGAPDVPLAEVSARIREILTQEKIDELFNSWLQSLRKESKVRTLLPLDPQADADTGGGSR